MTQNNIRINPFNIKDFKTLCLPAQPSSSMKTKDIKEIGKPFDISLKPLAATKQNLIESKETYHDSVQLKPIDKTSQSKTGIFPLITIDTSLYIIDSQLHI